MAASIIATHRNREKKRDAELWKAMFTDLGRHTDHEGISLSPSKVQSTQRQMTAAFQVRERPVVRGCRDLFALLVRYWSRCWS